MKKRLSRRVLNRTLATLARVLPGATSLRPRLHRWRGVKIGDDVFIGDEVYLENEYPECIEIGDNTALAPRVMIMAHVGRSDRKEGQIYGKVVIGKNVFVGTCAIIAAAPKRTLVIGDGAVIGAGTVVVNQCISQQAFISPPPWVEIGRALISFPMARSYEHFLSGLRRREKRLKPGGK